MTSRPVLGLSNLKQSWVPRVALAAQKSWGPSNSIALSDLCEIVSGLYVPEYVSKATTTAAPYLRVDNIRPFTANLNEDDLVCVRTDQLPSSISASPVMAGDVLVARTGTLGKATLAGRPLEGARLSQHVTRLRVKPRWVETVPPSLLCGLLNTRLGQSLLNEGGSGSTRLELTHERLGAIRIPLVHARSVAATLARGIDELYESASLISQAISEYEDSLGLSDLRGQLPAASQMTAIVRIGASSPSWIPRNGLVGQTVQRYIEAHNELVWTSLGTLATIARGRGTRVDHYSSSGIPFVRTSSLVNGGIDRFPDHYASAATVALFKQPVGQGDILLSIEGKIGQVALLAAGEQCAIKNHIELIRCHDRTMAPLVFLALSSVLGQVQMQLRTVVQSTIPGLANRSRELQIPVQTSRPAGSSGKQIPWASAIDKVQESLRLRASGHDSIREANASLEELLNGQSAE